MLARVFRGGRLRRAYRVAIGRANSAPFAGAVRAVQPAPRSTIFIGGRQPRCRRDPRALGGDAPDRCDRVATSSRGACPATTLDHRKSSALTIAAMTSGNQPDLLEVDWSKIPAPQDDGAARHLTGIAVPDVPLPATDGTQVSLAAIPGRVVLFAYPRTGVPGQISPVDGWDMIPGSRGCTPQTCAFRDLHKEIITAGAARVFGLSTQDTDYQREAVRRLH